MTGFSRNRLVLPLLAVVMAAAGCGLFKTREPDAPSEPPPRHSPTAPDSVLFNFDIALEYRASGAPQLAETLSGSFELILDTPDANRLGFDTVERADFEQANRDFQASRVGTNRLRFRFGNDIVRPLITGSEAFYDDLPYELVIFNFTGPGNTELIVEKVSGTVDLFMTRSTNWAMSQWIDKGDGDISESYGYYMGAFSGISAP